MKEWKPSTASSSSERIYVVKKGKKIVQGVKTSDIGGINHYHSIRAGMANATKEDCDQFFLPLKKYRIEINGEVVKDKLEWNKHFYHFFKCKGESPWIISKTVPNENGKGHQWVDIGNSQKRRVHSEILKILVRKIEEDWSKQYENSWRNIVQVILKQINKAPLALNKVPAVKRKELITFAVSILWRTLPYPKELVMTLKGIEKAISFDFPIPKKQRMYPFLDSTKKELYHSYMLNQFRDFLKKKDDKGIIGKKADLYCEKYGVSFKITTSEKPFITTDNAIVENHLNLVFPITPLLLAVIEEVPNQSLYTIEHLTTNKVDFYNQLLFQNANDFCIVNSKDLSSYPMF